VAIHQECPGAQTLVTYSSRRQGLTMAGVSNSQAFWLSRFQEHLRAE
jgi:hypothetical protein